MMKFTVSDQTSAEAPPHEFELEGTYVKGTTGPGGQTTWTLSLAATPTPGLGALDQLRDAVITDPITRRTAYNPASVIGFIRNVMMPDSIIPFDELVNDRTRIVEMTALGGVVEWLSGLYVGGPVNSGPTGAPSSSSTGGAGNGSGQTDGLPRVG